MAATRTPKRYNLEVATKKIGNHVTELELLTLGAQGELRLEVLLMDLTEKSKQLGWYQLRCEDVDSLVGTVANEMSLEEFLVFPCPIHQFKDQAGNEVLLHNDLPKIGQFHIPRADLERLIATKPGLKPGDQRRYRWKGTQIAIREAALQLIQLQLMGEDLEIFPESTQGESVRRRINAEALANRIHELRNRWPALAETNDGKEPAGTSRETILRQLRETLKTNHLKTGQ